MQNKIVITFTAAIFAASTLSFATVTTLALSSEAAVAGNGKGNSGNNGNNGRNRNSGNNNSNNSNNNRGGNGNSSGNGQIASSLGALNAANANQNALNNASPNSRVGRIAAYQQEAILTHNLAAEAAAAVDALSVLTVPSRTSLDIQAAIDAAVLAGQNTTSLEAELVEALTYESAVATVQNAITAVAEQEVIEAAALEAASNKGVPTGEALAALRLMLGLE